MLDEEQHQQAGGEFRNRTVDRRPGSSRRSTAHTDNNVDTVESLLLSREDKHHSHRTVREISREAGRSVDHQFRRFLYFHKNLHLMCYKKRCARQLTEAHSMHALFLVCSLRDDNMITSKPTRKLKHANSILEPSEHFCQISSKSIHISSYTVSKLGHT